MYDKILFCSDLFVSTDQAFLNALQTANDSDAQLLVFHVLESGHRYSGHVETYDAEVVSDAEIFDKIAANLKKYYSKLISSNFKDKIEIKATGGVPIPVASTPDIRYEVRGGNAIIEILRFARKEDIDLIVMGSYTLSSDGELDGESKVEPKGEPKGEPRLGTNVKQILLSAKCPVLIVTPPGQRLNIEPDD